MSLRFQKVNLFSIKEIKMNVKLIHHSHINKTKDLKSNGALQNNNLSIVILTCSYIHISSLVFSPSNGVAMLYPCNR